MSSLASLDSSFGWTSIQQDTEKVAKWPWKKIEAWLKRARPEDIIKNCLGLLYHDHQLELPILNLLGRVRLESRDKIGALKMLPVEAMNIEAVKMLLQCEDRLAGKEGKLLKKILKDKIGQKLYHFDLWGLAGLMDKSQWNAEQGKHIQSIFTPRPKWEKFTFRFFKDKKLLHHLWNQGNYNIAYQGRNNILEARLLEIIKNSDSLPASVSGFWNELEQLSWLVPRLPLQAKLAKDFMPVIRQLAGEFTGQRAAADKLCALLEKKIMLEGKSGGLKLKSRQVKKM